MSVHVLHPSSEFPMNLQYKLKADLKNKQRDSLQDRGLNVTGNTRPISTEASNRINIAQPFCCCKWCWLRRV